VQEWLAQPGRRVTLHFIPAYCPHLNPIERLWGLMHKHLTQNSRTILPTSTPSSGPHPSPGRLGGAVLAA
jgi:DDE superfamily endonuclease